MQVWRQIPTSTRREGKAKAHPFPRHKSGLERNLQCHRREEKGGKGITLHFGSGWNQILLPGVLERSTEKMVSPSSPSWQRLQTAHFVWDSAPQPFLMGCSLINCHHINFPSCSSLFSQAGSAEIPESQPFPPRLRPRCSLN